MEPRTEIDCTPPDDGGARLADIVNDTAGRQWPVHIARFEERVEL